MKKVTTLFLMLALSIAFPAFLRIPIAEVGTDVTGAASDAFNTAINSDFPALHDSVIMLNFIMNEDFYIQPVSSEPRGDALWKYTFGYVFNSDSICLNVPWAFFQGSNRITPVNAVLDSLHNFAARADSTPFYLWFDRITEDSIYVNVTADDPSILGTLYFLSIFIIENSVTVPGSAVSEYNWVVRDIRPWYSGELIVGSEILYDTFTVATAYERSYGWFPWNNEVIAVLRKTDLVSRELLQAAKEELPLPSYMFAANRLGPVFYIAEKGDVDTFFTYAINYGTNPDTVRLNMVINAPAIWSIEGITKFGTFTSTLDLPLAVGAIETVKIVVQTDPINRGTGNIHLSYTGSMAHDTFYFRFSETTGDDIILIDDDMGAPDSAWQYPLEKYYMDALDNLHKNYFYYDYFWGVPELSMLDLFDIVIWYTGWFQFYTLESIDRYRICKYLDDGGKLLLSGDNIIRDLILDMSGTDPGFVRSYLHVNHFPRNIWDTAGTYIVYGVPVDPITDGIFFELIEGTGSNTSFWSQTAYADAVKVIDGAEPILHYGPGTSQCAGLRFTDGNFALVFLPFGFESIDNSVAREFLLDKIINWLYENSINESKSQIPEETSLFITPNPFNSICEISYSIYGDGFLEIYDINGRKIKRIIVRENGKYIWDASSQPSGVYLVRLGNTENVINKKVYMLK